jgi:hypothetical protein
MAAGALVTGTQIAVRVIAAFGALSRRFHASLPWSIESLRRTQHPFVEQRVVSTVRRLESMWKNAGSHPCAVYATYETR